MSHYKVESHGFGGGGLAGMYPHSPEDLPLSIQEYLEDMWDLGWSLDNVIVAPNDTFWVFKANAQ